jgi:putative membrane protein
MSGPRRRANRASTELITTRRVDRTTCSRFSIFSLEDKVRLFSIGRRSIIALGCVLVAGPALAQSAAEKTGVNSALGISPTTADFVKEVAISDMFEIESSKLAQDKGNAPEKKFASQMVADHTKTSSELKGLVGGGKVKAELPTALDSSHLSKLDKLRGESGKDFSSDFNSMQLSAHKDAVSLFERYAKGGDNADLKNWAGKTLPALKHHRAMAESLKK